MPLLKERINVMLAPEVLKQADRQAWLHNLTRSDLIAMAITEFAAARKDLDDMQPMPPAEQARKVREYKRTTSRKK
jgi:hypothetical protein